MRFFMIGNREFAQAVYSRLVIGANEYGSMSFLRPPGNLAG
jgi:hypothetical protein